MAFFSIWHFEMKKKIETFYQVDWRHRVYKWCMNWKKEAFRSFYEFCKFWLKRTNEESLIKLKKEKILLEIFNNYFEKKKIYKFAKSKLERVLKSFKLYAYLLSEKKSNSQLLR